LCASSSLVIPSIASTSSGTSASEVSVENNADVEQGPHSHPRLWKDTGLVQAAQAHPATCETLIGLLLTVRVFTVVPVRVDTNAVSQRTVGWQVRL
jgi:hypothetical protein